MSWIFFSTSDFLWIYTFKDFYKMCVCPRVCQQAMFCHCTIKKCMKVCIEFSQFPYVYFWLWQAIPPLIFKNSTRRGSCNIGFCAIFNLVASKSVWIFYCLWVVPMCDENRSGLFWEIYKTFHIILERNYWWWIRTFPQAKLKASQAGRCPKVLSELRIAQQK